MNYYAKFVWHFATLAAPLHQLLCKNVAWVWTIQHDQAVAFLKQALTTTPVLQMPDFTKPFCIECDALEWAVGGTLMQPYGDAWLPVSYLSKALTSAQQNYAMHDHELYAIVVCCERWWPYIQSQHTTVLTDHEPLKHFMMQPTLSKR